MSDCRVGLAPPCGFERAVWFGSIRQIAFEQVDEAVGVVKFADGVEVPAICAAYHAGKGHGAGVVCRVAADVVAADFLAFAIDRADVGAAHAGEALFAFVAFVDGNGKDDLPERRTLPLG